MLRLFVVVVISSSLLIVGDAKNFITKSKEPKDLTVPCVFRSIRNCYESIGSLGANLTIEFPRSDRDLNETCSKKASNFTTCAGRIENECGTKLGSAITAVQNEVREICKNGSAIQKSFLNATKCLNLNVPGTRKCYFKYATNSTDDAKSLCCSVFKTKRCVRSMSYSQCSKNATKLREELLQTYYGYADTLCGKYYKQCNAAVAVAPTSAWILALLFFISTIKIL